MATVNLPYDFVGGTRAIADQVDANFSALVNAFAINLPVPLTVALGGTGATSAPAALTALGAMPLAGGTLTGALTVPGLYSTSGLEMTAPAGTTKVLRGANPGPVSRWDLMLGDTTAESGSNAGSNFQLIGWADDGSYLHTPLSIVRSTGIATFSQPIVQGSDVRAKEDVKPIEGALATVKALQGVVYRMKGQAKRQIGLIAQDVAEVLPEVVFQTGPPVDADGKALAGDPMLGIAYPNIVAALIEAVKTLADRVEVLEQSDGNGDSSL
jgi:hypothetical protein